MKIKVYSDLHININNISSPRDIFEESDDVDLYIDAGDTGTINATINFYKDTFWKNKRVILIAGNHLCYGAGETIKKSINDLKKEFPKESNITFLENDFVEINGYKIIGSTLWTDFSCFKGIHEYCKKICSEQLNDYSFIMKYKNILLTPNDTVNFNLNSFNFIKKNVKKGKNIVVSHHTPSLKSCSLEYINNPITAGFCNTYDEFIRENTDNILMWIHGHVHNPSYYTIGRTGVVCNPMGYLYMNENDSFDKNMVIEV